MPWTRTAWDTAQRQNWILTAAQALDSGLGRTEIERLVRSGRWRRLFRGVYLIQGDTMAADLADEILIRAAHLALGPHSVAVRKTAALLHHIPGWQATGTPLEFAIPPQAAAPKRILDRSIKIHQWTLPLEQIEHVAGIPATNPLRTVSDILLTTRRMEAIATLDAALNRKVLTTEDLDRLLSSFYRRRGAVLARAFAAEADARAESPLESIGRLRLVDGGVPPDDLQVDIFAEDGRFLGRADMLWRRPRLIAEADGAAFHDRPEALYRDRRRQNDLVRAGYRVVRFTWDDVTRPSYLPALIQSMINQRPPR
ncbi:type IV toxin-antitoxin system AbiEi family antitoxin domain-containing protein [Hamadaea sp. NPDC050747]|uniref:type IV toxin-antitoxin system AbiEi family antitoxin domain-containing protein n=1 Tax=Hamadaea sp. NPDC050747 TaxID=3155789 RepID=UPI00340E7B99